MMKKKTKKILIWVLVALAAAIVIWLVFGRTEKDQETVQVTRGNIETYYTYSGTLEASKKEDVMAGGSYTIDEVYVGAGSVVDEDTLLMDADSGEEWYPSIDGRVIGIGADPGDDVTAQTVLATIVDPATWQVTLNVDEYDVAQMQVGESVTVKVNSLGLTLSGSIKRIASEAVQAGNLSVFPVTISVSDDGTLKPGRSVEVQIPKASVQDVLVLPVKAIKYDTDGKAYVYTISSDNKTVTTDIETGISDSRYTEITSGLTEGQTVIIPTQSLEDQMSSIRSEVTSSSDSSSSDSQSDSGTDQTNG